MVVIEKQKNEDPVKAVVVKKSVAIINKRKQPTKVKKLDKDKLWRMDIKVKKWIKIKFGKLRK